MSKEAILEGLLFVAGDEGLSKDEVKSILEAISSQKLPSKQKTQKKLLFNFYFLFR